MRVIFQFAAIIVAMICTSCNSFHGTAERSRCDRRTDRQCATDALAVAEKQLGETYQHVADKEEDEGVKRLGISQRNWVKYRDSYVEFIAARAPDTPTLQLLSTNQRIDMTLARIEELRRQLIKK